MVDEFKSYSHKQNKQILNTGCTECKLILLPERPQKKKLCCLSASPCFKKLPWYPAKTKIFEAKFAVHSQKASSRSAVAKPKPLILALRPRWKRELILKSTVNISEIEC